MTPLFFRKVTNVSELYIASFCRAENIGISFSADRNLQKASLALLKNAGVFI
jgi:arabinogalactan endo-1,4-beta-galactosidase